MSEGTRKELISVTRERYAQSNRKGKTMILDEFQVLTGCHRKHLIRILQEQKEKRPAKRKIVRQKIYDEGVKKAVLILWETTGRICSKRLKAIIPLLLDSLEHHGHLDVSPAIRERLLKISASTIDKLGEPLGEDFQHFSRVSLTIEDEETIIRVTDDCPMPKKAWFDLFLEPFIEDLVEIDIGEKG